MKAETGVKCQLPASSRETPPPQHMFFRATPCPFEAKTNIVCNPVTLNNVKCGCINACISARNTFTSGDQPFGTFYLVFSQSN